MSFSISLLQSQFDIYSLPCPPCDGWCNALSRHRPELLVVTPRWAKMAVESPLIRAVIRTTAGHRGTILSKVLKGCKRCRPEGQMLNTLWLRETEREDGATVSGRLQWEAEKVRHRDCEAEGMRMSSAFTSGPQSVETSAHRIRSNQAVIKVFTSLGKKSPEIVGREAILLKPLPAVRWRSGPSRWWKWASALIRGSDWHMCWPVSGPKISPSPPPPLSPPLHLSHGFLPWFIITV